MIRIVRLGSDRVAGEGTRLGTVRRPPRGVRKENYARENWYDVWLPNLAPSAALIARTNVLKDHVGWKSFAKGYKAELQQPDAAHLLDALAALSHTANFSLGCYCEDEAYCHRSLLREALVARGAAVEKGTHV